LNDIIKNLKKRVDLKDDHVFMEAVELAKIDLHAHYIIGLCYISDVGVARNKKHGIKHLKFAANGLNMVEAMILLGDLFSGDYDKIKSNFKQAKYYYNMAVNQGSLQAVSNLGNILYAKGFHNEGFNLVQKAYNEGYREDAWLLSRYYELSNGNFQDKVKALSVMLDIKMPDGFELVRIARMYKNGIGTTVNECEAFKFYQAAAIINYPLGLRELGLCYLLGVGTNKYFKLAEKYLKKAADFNDFRALDIWAEVESTPNMETHDFSDYRFFEPSKVDMVARYLSVRNKLKFTKNHTM